MRVYGLGLREFFVQEMVSANFRVSGQGRLGLGGGVGVWGLGAIGFRV